MSILPDHEIRNLNVGDAYTGVCPPGKISYGVSSYGYDVRVGYKFKIFHNALATVVDPKNFDPRSFIDVDVTPRHVWCLEIDSVVRKECVYCGRRYSEEEESTLCRNCAVPDHVLIPPNSFALAQTIETFAIPRDVLCLCVGKSTYARCGIIVNVTPLEPEWQGYVTIEISNTTPLPARIYAGEGIAQILFFRADSVCEVSYADKKGKYQGQKDITLPFVR